MQYSDQQIEDIKHEYILITSYLCDINEKIKQISLNNTLAQDYITKGLFRRLFVMHRAIENVFTIYPADRLQPLKEYERHDVEINIESFIINTSGCLDNMAWVWTYEKDLFNKNPKLTKFDVSLQKNKKIRKTFSPEFKNYLKNIDEWVLLNADYRDALAHKIKAYLAPYVIYENDLNEKYALPLFSLDVDKMLHIAFHYQILIDFKTIKELSFKFIDELLKN